MRDVQEIIKSMLVEKVAHTLGDSGGAYGYIHEKNVTRDFENEDVVSIDISSLDKDDTSNDIDYSISVYHYLTKALEFNEFTEEVNDTIQSARKLYDDGHDDVEYPHWSQDCMDVVNTLIDDEIEIGEIINTCNYESNLDQTLLYTPFVYQENHYVMLQVHGGCDVRGGYTDAVCFQVEDLYGCEMAMLPIQDVYGDIDGKTCSNTYDGCNITSDGDCTHGEEMELKFNDDGECVSEVNLSFMDY